MRGSIGQGSVGGGFGADLAPGDPQHQSSHALLPLLVLVLVPLVPLVPLLVVLLPLPLLPLVLLPVPLLPLPPLHDIPPSAAYRT